MHFFKKKDDSNPKMSSSTSNPQTLGLKQPPSKMPRIEFQVVESIEISTLQHDPGYILLINRMKLEVFILKLVHIDSFLLIVLNIYFWEMKKIAENFNHLGIR
jgi:hypothetical protein